MTQADISIRSPQEILDRAQLQTEVAELRKKIGDLEIRRDQIARQRVEAKPADRALYDKESAAVQPDLNITHERVGVVSEQIAQFDRTHGMIQGREGQPVLTVPPRQPDLFGREELRGIEIGGFVLLIPIVLAFARRIWVRSGPRATSFDYDSSPRLQRIEQAVESIAIEVERIGEAQRFTTKLFSDRQSDVIASQIPPASGRRETGTITPH